MKKRLTALIPYAIVLAANFYALPLLSKNTGTAMLIMLCVMPLVTLACSLICGAARGFYPLLPLLAVGLFIPTIFLYYNGSAWIYVVIHGVLSLAGNGVGRIFYRRR